MLRKKFAGLVFGWLVCFSLPATAGQLVGDYLEVRNADVYTGPCFANAEVGLSGNEAIMAWKVRTGEWKGERLDGLAVVAVIRASNTLGDYYHSILPVKALLIVDQKANGKQKEALMDFAREMGGPLLRDVVQTDSAPISMETGLHERHGEASLRAGSLAVIRTRPISEKDHFCGNEETYYPPLTRLSHSMPAFALADEYHGHALGSEWRLYDKRSAFVGTFGADDAGETRPF